MFFTYLRRELRRRARQSSIIVVGLGLGIGLVITVAALSTGVKDAQATVLHSLYGVGTDVTVTKAPAAGSGGPGDLGFQGRTGTQDQPAAGTRINVDNLSPIGRGTIAQSSVDDVAALRGVSAATGSLSLTDTKISGRIPAINPSQGGTRGGPPTTQEGGSQSPPGGDTFRGSFTPSSFSVDGVQLTGTSLGPLSTGTVTSGRALRASDATTNVAVVDSDYAKQEKLKAGSTITIAKHAFDIVGIVSIPASSSSDVFIPLARAQALADLKGKVTTVYVSATSSTQIDAVSKEISSLLPSATVTSSSNLADQVSGSVASASSLADRLGRWLAIAVLVVSFLIASLLTMSAVSRRVRELGTLKALGWRSRRVVGQIMGESVTLGIIGGVVGVALGFLGAWVVTLVSPDLSATVGATSGTATPGGPQLPNGPPGAAPGQGGPPGFGRAAGLADQVVSVHLSAPVTASVVGAAVALAVLGGLISGSFGGWRAARLRPAAAMAKVS